MAGARAGEARGGVTRRQGGRGADDGAGVNEQNRMLRSQMTIRLYLISQQAFRQRT